MARYTIELKDVIAAGHEIFDFNYPFYDERKKPEFEEKFIRHFYFREIGTPTVDRFKFYLHEKMLTVFPYYNELFNAATIEYSVLNNYNLTEEFTVERDTQGKTAGVSSTVGQLFANQETESHNNRTVDTEGKAETVGHDVESETGNSVTDANGTTRTETSSTQTVNGSSDTTTTETIEDSKRTVRKFLDTPQGKTDLSNTNYLTDLTDTTETGDRERSATEKGTNSQTTNGSGTNETETNDHSETDTTRNATKESTVTNDSTGKETSVDNMTGTVKDEQKTTQDNNTRTFMDSKVTESHKLTRIGNIGVDTDSDMIEKHIRLQKTLKQIELLFFNECEDLFMMVY